MNLPSQARLIEILKKQVPENLSLPMELGQILGISADSAYRRLRCETAFTLDETALVCRHFDVPLEALNDIISGVVSFRYQPIEAGENSMRDYLAGFSAQVKTISQFKEKHIYYAAEDIPLFHVYAWPVLSDFKFFYWRKSILNQQDLQNKKYSLANLDEGLLEMAKNASLAYAAIESTEIWTEETISSTLMQIEFYAEAGLFESAEDASRVLDDLKGLLENLQRQCDLGLKIRPGGSVSATPFHCHASDLMIGNNCVLVKTDKRKISFLGYNTFNFMSTGNPLFNEQNARWMENLIAKSTQISRSAEKIRNQFFRTLLRRLEETRKKLED